MATPAMDGSTDARTSIALGVMLFEMLAGRPLFEAASVDGPLVQHLHAERPRLPRKGIVHGGLANPC